MGEQNINGTYMALLADALEDHGEDGIHLGPTDARLSAMALRLFARLKQAGLFDAETGNLSTC